MYIRLRDMKSSIKLLWGIIIFQAVILLLIVVHQFVLQPSEVEIESDISEGNQIMLFVNGSDLPRTIGIIPGKNFVYKFEALPRLLFKLRLDPTDLNNAKFAIKKISVNTPFYSWSCNPCAFNKYNVENVGEYYYSRSNDPILMLQFDGNGLLIDAYLNLLKLGVLILLINYLIFMTLQANEISRLKSFVIIIQTNLIMMYGYFANYQITNRLQSSAEVIGYGNYFGYSFMNTSLTAYSLFAAAGLFTILILCISKR